MTTYYPSQTRSVDAYGNDRYATAINRQSRIITGGKNVLYSFNDYNNTDPTKADVFPMNLSMTNGDVDSPLTETINRWVKIGPGISVIDDVVIHTKNINTTTDGWTYLDLWDKENYLTYPNEIDGPGTPPLNNGSDYAYYYIVMSYNFTRAYPPVRARFFFIKNKDLYYDRRSELLYLATAKVSFDTEYGDNGNYKIDELSLNIKDGNYYVYREYPIRYPIDADFGLNVDGGMIDGGQTIYMDYSSFKCEVNSGFNSDINI